jgi:hypothetical protein
LSINDYLILAGTFHGYSLPFPLPNQRWILPLIFIHSIHAITSRLIPPQLLPPPPQKATGIEILESEAFRLQCFQTLTGTKFLLFTEPHQMNADAVLRRVYELYADYVMKNPFYQNEMPIRCEAFDRHLGSYVKSRQ